MSKHTVFTSVTPLPAGVTRETVMAAFRDHASMIDLNPYVEERHPMKAPRKASAEEYGSIWYSITDKISYLPGLSGRVTYHACFHDLPDGLQTHCYAPLGVDIRERWSVGGNEPGEPRQAPPMGIGAPAEGLYIREDIDMRCNIMYTRFVKKNLKNAHTTLVQRLVNMASTFEAKAYNARLAASNATGDSSLKSYSPTDQASSNNSMRPSPISPIRPGMAGQAPAPPAGAVPMYIGNTNAIEMPGEDPKHGHADAPAGYTQQPGWNQQQTYHTQPVEMDSQQHRDPVELE